MTSKIDKLDELSELLKIEAITKDEFEILKREILNGENPKVKNDGAETKTTIKVESKINKEKIILKSFNDSDGNRINSPNIEYINFKDITIDEIRILQPFIKLKQIHSPSEMTEDEIKLGNKIFSTSDISKMNSERDGFNYAFGAIFSVVLAGTVLYFIVLSPCMIFLGAGTSGIASIIIAVTVLNKPDATKLDKGFSYLSLGLIVIAFIVFKVTWWGAKD